MHSFFYLFLSLFYPETTRKNAKIGKNLSGNKRVIESLKWLFLPAPKTQNGDMFGFYGQISVLNLVQP